ncbi:uncharacterized protein [Musca autumnalis]|uniref:uncharacterized protein n=1 Tax=Musca autumnalis TaxID=221902 RepID=UPI003CF4D865
MRSLIVLCFLAYTAAAPQGYHYAGQPGGQYLAAAVAANSVALDNTVQHHVQQPVVTKRFFIHSAPEEEETEVQHHDIVVGMPRRNYNIVFVKSPVAKQQKTVVRVIPAVQEDRTAIYVLAKNADKPQVETYVEEPQTTTSKPEVFFIKYKTNAEAVHAQHNIQAEYDRLGGSSIVSDEGISSVSSVIGSLDNLQLHQVQTAVDSNSGAGAYLPPVKKH